jgi:hypothetical protein
VTPRDITDADVEYYARLNPRMMVFAADNETVSPVQALRTKDEADGFPVAIRVAWTLTEIDLMHLAKGGTLWLTCMGSLPAHHLHVQAPA